VHAAEGLHACKRPRARGLALSLSHELRTFLEQVLLSPSLNGNGGGESRNQGLDVGR